MEGLKWVNSSLNSAAIEQRTLYLSSSSVNKDVPAVRIYKKAFTKTMGGRISRARAARRASRINPSPAAGEDDGSPREVIVADFSEESIPLGLREDDMRRRGSDSGSDSDTIDEEEAAESDVDEIGGSDDEDDGKPKPDIVLLDVVDSGKYRYERRCVNGKGVSFSSSFFPIPFFGFEWRATLCDAVARCELSAAYLAYAICIVEKCGANEYVFLFLKNLLFLLIPYLLFKYTLPNG